MTIRVTEKLQSTEHIDTILIDYINKTAPVSNERATDFLLGELYDAWLLINDYEYHFIELDTNGDQIVVNQVDEVIASATGCPDREFAQDALNAFLRKYSQCISVETPTIYDKIEFAERDLEATVQILRNGGVHEIQELLAYIAATAKELIKLHDAADAAELAA